MHICSLNDNGIGGYYVRNQQGVYYRVATPEVHMALAEGLKGNSTLTSLS